MAYTALALYLPPIMYYSQPAVNGEGTQVPELQYLPLPSQLDASLLPPTRLSKHPLLPPDRS